MVPFCICKTTLKRCDVRRGNFCIVVYWFVFRASLCHLGMILPAGRAKTAFAPPEEHWQAVREGAGWTFHPHVRLPGLSGLCPALSQEGGLCHRTWCHLGGCWSSARHQRGAHHGHTGKHHVFFGVGKKSILFNVNIFYMMTLTVCFYPQNLFKNVYIFTDSQRVMMQYHIVFHKKWRERKYVFSMLCSGF